MPNTHPTVSPVTIGYGVLHEVSMKPKENQDTLDGLNGLKKQIKTAAIMS